jgi:hypothetical protein
LKQHSTTFLTSPPQEQQEHAEAQAIGEVIVAEIIGSRETLGKIQFKSMENLVRLHPELVAGCLNEYYTRTLIDAVSGYVRRTLELSQMESEETPSPVTNTYIREATRAYILGLPQASIALCRAALEQGLKERLGYQLTGTYIRFQDLLAEARRYHLLDYVTEPAARDVNNAADDVLHEEPTELSKARDVLDKLRGVLQHIYSAEGHP